MLLTHSLLSLYLQSLNSIMGSTVAACRCLPGSTPQAPSQNLSANQPTRQRKRFNPFFQPNPQTLSQLSLQEKYRFLSNYEDRFMGRCSVLEEIESGELVLCKEMEFRSDALCREHVERLRRKKQQQEGEESLLQILEVFGKRVDGLLKDLSKSTLILQYPLLSLKREFNSRLLHKLHFQLQEIQNFVHATIRGYSALETHGSRNDKVRMAHIFLGLKLKESLIKVVDSELLEKGSNLQLMRDGGFRDPQNHDVYLSPEQFAAVAEGRELASEDKPKSAVFSLGATILDLCIMNTSFDVYHYDEKYMRLEQFKGLVNIARKRHGTMLYKLLNLMLEADPQKRPSFTELILIMQTYLSQSQSHRSSMRLSSVNSDSKYLESTRHAQLSQTAMSQSLHERQFCKGGQLVQEEQSEELVHMHEQYIQGSQYIGQKKRDLKHGKGKYIFKDRSYYEGSWKDDMMHGQGQLFFADGRLEYHGEWAYDEPNGWGILYVAAHADPPKVWTRFQGEVRNGEMHGPGKLYFVDGTVFQGEFQNGKVCGRGCRVSANGEAIEREWRLMNLQGLLTHEGNSSVQPPGSPKSKHL